MARVASVVGGAPAPGGPDYLAATAAEKAHAGGPGSPPGGDIRRRSDESGLGV